MFFRINITGINHFYEKPNQMTFESELHVLSKKFQSYHNFMSFIITIATMIIYMILNTENK